MSDQLVAETSTWQNTTLKTDKYPCPPVGFEPTISAGKRPQNHALDRAATGIGTISGLLWQNSEIITSIEWCRATTVTVRA